MSGNFHVLNRGKRSISVDLKQARGREIVERLAASADVLVQNFRPGVTDRLGLGWERALRAQSTAGLRVDERLRARRTARAPPRLRPHHPGAVGPGVGAGPSAR